MSGRVNEAAEPERVNDDEHWHRGPSQSCSICRFATERATAAVDVERLRVAIRLAHDEIAATDRLSLAIDEPLLIATKYDEMTNAARLSGESDR